MVGSSHRGKLGRIFPGSVGESLLRGAPCAVAVAPRGFARREHAGFHRIGIAYDGSEEADLALKEAERLAAVCGRPPPVDHSCANAVAVLVQVALAGELLDDIREEFHRVQERGLSQLGEKTESEAVFMEGDPAAVLAEQAIELDLLVMGSRSYGPVRSALLGAISSAVMRTASCPVLITPRGLAHTPETEQRRASHELAVEQ